MPISRCWLQKYSVSADSLPAFQSLCLGDHLGQIWWLGYFELIFFPTEFSSWLLTQKLPAFTPCKEKAFRRWATGCMENCLHVFVWTSNQFVFLMPKFPSSNHYHSLFSTSWPFLYLQRLLVCATITPYGLLLGPCCFLMSDRGLLSSLSILS